MNRGTETRKKIKEYIIVYIKEHGYPPSVREIGEAVNLSSTSSVHRQLEIMLLMGMLESDQKPGTPRALRVPGMKYMTRDEMEEADWIPIENGHPKDDDYILISCEEYPLPVFGRYEEDKEGGKFYMGDTEQSFIAAGLIVNAWRPVIKPYRPKEA